jgi:hypothetical protein
MENKFTEDDKKKVIDYLNRVAKSAKFNLDTMELIEYYQLLSHMQKVILPKIEANILEITKIVEAKPETKAEKKGK